MRLNITSGKSSAVGFVLLAFLCFCGTKSLGQNLGDSGRSSRSDFIEEIPNPESELLGDQLEVYAYTANPSVARELGLSDEVLRKINHLHQVSGGALSQPTATFRGSTSDEAYAVAVAVLMSRMAENAEEVKGLLNAAQVSRLKQLIYQIEIKRNGLQVALVDGHLGRSIGIKDFQKPALITRADAIDANVLKELSKAEETVASEVGSDLTAEQLQMLKKLLGKPIDLRKVISGLPAHRTPDPESNFEIAHLLKDDMIADELYVAKAERRAVLNAIKKRSISVRDGVTEQEAAIANAKRLAEIRAVMEEQLDKVQIDRLKEIASRMEMERSGLVHAIVDGFLGKRLGVSQDQIAKLRIRAAAIESKAKDSVVDISVRAQAELFKELDSLQQQRARELIGEPFAFVE